MIGKPSAALLCFVKAPLPGPVKSRLAAALGEEAARVLYRAFVEDILDAIDSTGMPCRIFVHPPDAVLSVAAWLGPQRRYLPQQGTDLGERMENAFRAIFAEGTGQAVLIGSDLPDLPARLLHDAFAALEQSGSVIGPAADGGYYLIGFRRETFHPGIFRDVHWSSAEVFERTMANLRNSNISTHILPRWQDVDTIEDLRDLARRTAGAAFAKSRTMRAVNRIARDGMGSEEHHV